MSDINLEYFRYKYRNDQKVVGRLFDKYRFTFKLDKYFDPKGSRQSSDFDQVARIGVWYALNSYDPSRGPLVPWIIRIVRSQLAAEVKKISRELNPEVSFDWTDENNDSPQDIIEKEVDLNIAYRPVDHIVANRLYAEYVDRVRKVLKRSENKKLIEIFNIRMLYPHWKNRGIASFMNLSVATISQSLSTIKMTMKMVSRDHSESYRDSGI